MKKKTKKKKRKSTRKSDKSDTIKKRIAEKQKLFIDIYPKRLCNIARTCKAIGISRETFYEWFNKFPKFKRACHEAKESLKDDLESQGYKLIFEEGDGRLLIFYLCNLAKDRGWSNRHMHEGGDADKPIRVVVQGVDLSKYPKPKESSDKKQ